MASLDPARLAAIERVVPRFEVINTNQNTYAVRDLNFELAALCRRNRDGSLARRASRHQRLQYIANTLNELGFRYMRADSLKPKHVHALVAFWQARDISNATLHNYMSDVRWWAEKVGRSKMMHPSNAAYGIPPRVYGNENKAKYLSEKQFERLQDPYVRMSARLQQAFGLRREESIKFQPEYADRTDFIALKGTWTKGGRPREIPIVEPEQRALLNQVHAFVGSGSLIPSRLLYKHQAQRYDKCVAAAGFNNFHGLRHSYAQRRYQQLTGWPCPAAGGLKRKELSPQQHEIDIAVRLQISKELGHNRIEITATYLG